MYTLVGETNQGILSGTQLYIYDNHNPYVTLPVFKHILCLQCVTWNVEMLKPVKIIDCTLDFLFQWMQCDVKQVEPVKVIDWFHVCFKHCMKWNVKQAEPV